VLNHIRSPNITISNALYPTQRGERLALLEHGQESGGWIAGLLTALGGVGLHA
jgi:hypothetical protein